MAAITCDYLIVGAGIVALTVAAEIKRRKPAASIVIVEKEARAGMHASGRNSGVMHSGIYYTPGTLKAQVCTEGARHMKAFAAQHGINCQHTGKVIIATSERDLPTIDRLLANAAANGIRAEKLDEQGVREIEPYATPYKAGIHSPDTFVIDGKAVLAKLQELLMAQGVTFTFGHGVNHLDADKRIAYAGPESFHYGYMFNCAGASADRIARLYGLCSDYTLVPFKGMYYKLRPDKAYKVRANIYPVPDIDLPFLGVHLTRVISDDVYVGPTAIPAFGRENYGILSGIKPREAWEITSAMVGMYIANQRNFRKLVHTEMMKYVKSSFVASAQRLMASLDADDLVPCTKIGIRPQLVNTKTKALEMDYIIEQTPDSLHVLNAISPAFTSSLAMAEMLADRANI